MRRTTDALFLAILCLLLVDSASAQAFRTETGRAEFTSSVPLHSFTGTSEKLNGRIDLAEGTVDFYLDLETLDTGIGKRDKDMRKTLETDKHPFAEFFGRLAAPVDAGSNASQDVVARGSFTIHGVSRDIEVPGTLTKEGAGWRLEAAWELRLEDYDIEPPSLLIMKVDQVQKLAISALLTPESR